MQEKRRGAIKTERAQVARARLHLPLPLPRMVLWSYIWWWLALHACMQERVGNAMQIGNAQVCVQVSPPGSPVQVRDPTRGRTLPSIHLSDSDSLI